MPLLDRLPRHVTRCRRNAKTSSSHRQHHL